jgi:Membrane domain of glycerophosphoryl diester phosphodiesterase
MTNRKLDMGKAWTEATGLIVANRDTLGAIAGLFFFVPSLAIALFAPELASSQSPAPAGTDPQVAMQAMMDQLTQAYAANWPLVAAATLLQFIGSLSLLALLSDRAHPTVREALKSGLAGLLPYLAALLLNAFGAGLLAGLPFAVLAALGSPAAAVLGLLVMLVIILYVMVKFILIAPVIAIEGERNPIAAMQRSWRLTKGNSFHIAVFVLLLFFTIGIIAALVTGIIGLALSALGSQVASIGGGMVNAAINAGVGVIFMAVFAAIHRQLAGHTPEGLAATFE